MELAIFGAGLLAGSVLGFLVYVTKTGNADLREENKALGLSVLGERKTAAGFEATLAAEKENHAGTSRQLIATEKLVTELAEVVARFRSGESVGDDELPATGSSMLDRLLDPDKDGADQGAGLPPDVPDSSDSDRSG